MAETWFTYRQLADHWKTTPEAARARSRRGNYRRRTNNLGAVEILVDTDQPVPEARRKHQDGQTGTATPSHTPDTESPSATTVKLLEALQAHVDTLKAEITKADARADQFRQERDAERDRVADLTAQLLKITADLLEARKGEAVPRSWWARLVG